MKRFAILMSVALCLAGAAVSRAAEAVAPPEGDFIAENAKWVMYADLEAAFGSRFGRLMLEDDPYDTDLADRMDETRRQTGLDFTKDVHWLVAYGMHFEDGPEVVVAETTDAIDRLIEHLREAEESYREVTLDGRTVHTWRDGAGYVKDRGGDRLVVVTKSLDALAAAMGVVEGDGEGMSVAEAFADRDVRRGAFLMAACADLDGMDHGEGDHPFGRIARHTKSVFVQMGESDDRVFAALSLGAEDADRARDVVQIGQGLVALGRIVADEAEPAHEARRIRDLLGAITFDASDQAVRVTVEFDVDELPGTENQAD